MKTFGQFVTEKQHDGEIPFDKNPKIGWWKDHDHVTLYHGTHASRVDSIKKHGLKAPEHGPTKGNISMALEPHTAHGYASMHGGESSFRAAGAQAHHVPHHERAVMVYRVPRAWAEKHANQHLRGNTDDVRDNLTDREKYLAHKRAGKTDHEHYAKTELRFSHLPNEYLVGHMRKVKS
jgi:hypothetical protein